MSDMRDDRITVRLPAELHRQLKDVARRTRRRESDLVRETVERQLAAEEAVFTAYEQVKKAGLIAAVRGVPSKLSTSPKNFEGFGKS